MLVPAIYLTAVTLFSAPVLFGHHLLIAALWAERSSGNGRGEMRAKPVAVRATR